MYKKRIVIGLLFCLNLLTISAQHYRGSIDLSYSKGVGDIAYDKTQFNLVNGVQINPCFYLGIGVGISALESMKAIYAPVFLDFEAVLNQNKFSPFVDQRGGYAFNVYNDFDYLKIKGTYYGAYIGYRYKLNEKRALKLSVGYDAVIADQYKSFNIDAKAYKKNLGSLGLRLTYQF